MHALWPSRSSCSKPWWRRIPAEKPFTERLDNFTPPLVGIHYFTVRTIPLIPECVLDRTIPDGRNWMDIWKTGGWLSSNLLRNMVERPAHQRRGGGVKRHHGVYSADHDPLRADHHFGRQWLHGPHQFLTDKLMRKAGLNGKKKRNAHDQRLCLCSTGGDDGP